MRLLFSLILLLCSIHGKACDTLRLSVHFDSDKHHINTTAEEEISDILSELDQLNSCQIYLIGHTDPHGSIEYNEKLAKRRVNTVKDRLKSEGINQELHISSHGELKPTDQGQGDLADQNNRRVEVVIITPCIPATPDQNETTDSPPTYSYNPNWSEELPDKLTNIEQCNIDTFISNINCDLLLDQKNTITTVVMDWTRSMYPYGVNLYNWHLKNLDKSNIQYLCIFNDGDKKEQKEKLPGKTRGIYFENAREIDEVLKLMKSVAKRGTGGDFPENYIEALIRTEKRYPKTDTIVLLADNRACIRDYELIGELTKPVNIILNEIDPKENVINYQFLNLAAATGGRVSFMGQNLPKLELKNQRVKPKYLEDSIVYVPRVKGGLKAFARNRDEYLSKYSRYSIPAILTDGENYYAGCSTSKLIINNVEYSIGCADCLEHDWPIKNHTTFKFKYTPRQIIAIVIKATGRGVLEVVKLPITIVKLILRKPPSPKKPLIQ